MKRFIFGKILIYSLIFLLSHSALAMNILPKEVIPLILSHCHDNDRVEIIAAKKTLNNIIKLQIACKTFNSFFTIKNIGIIFNKFNDTTKTQLLEDIITSKKENVHFFGIIDSTYYQSKSFFSHALALSVKPLEANAENKLIRSALFYDDIFLIKDLCSNKKININNIDWDKVPLFFYARTIKMAQACEQYVEFNRVTSRDCLYPNILWVAAARTYIPSELLDFYLKQDINIILRPFDNISLLHRLALVNIKDHNDISNTLKKIALLIAAKPELIDVCDTDKKTTIDYLKLIIKKNHESTDYGKKFLKLLKHYKKTNQLLPQ